MHHATIKVAEIKLDILDGCFDTTLEKYKAISATQPQPARPQQPVIQEPKEETIKKTEAVIVLKDLIPKFNIWANTIRNIDVENIVYTTFQLVTYWKDGEILL